MKQYLIDTDILIYYIKGFYELNNKFDEIGLENCFVSEITIAELFYGVEKSKKKNKNRVVVEDIKDNITVLPISNVLEIYAKEKVRLENVGTPVDDFDLLIASTAIAHDLILVTNNEKHFKRIANLKYENWV